MPKNRGVLADPTRLKPFDDDHKNLIQVIIETPKSSRNKYAFDAQKKIFKLKKVLPAGMIFPYDFGFIPSTKGEDGDPLDVLVLMDEPALPGCLVPCRIVGVIEGDQYNQNSKEKLRNDRIIAVAHENHSWADIKKISDLGDRFCRELEAFFTDYHKLSNEQYHVIAAKGPKTAYRLIKDGISKA